MSDAVPPSASVAYFDAGGQEKRSQGYGMLLGALLPESGTDLRTVLGDQYANWLNYRNSWWSSNPTSTLTQEQLFAQWANRVLDPRLAQSAINTFKQAANAPLNAALDAYHASNAKQQFVDTAGNPYALYIYSATVDAAKAAIATGASATIAFDSSTMDTKLTHTTVEGSASGFYDIFSGGASGSFDQLDQMAASSDWSIAGTIGQYATLVSQPGSWFSSGEFSRAYNGEGDNTIWDPMANVGDWDSFFAQPNGSLARRVSQLVLVSDYDITVTSHATYSSEDATKIEAKAEFGIWPFFSSSVSSSHTTSVSRNADGGLVVNHRLAKGLIQIWGVNVQNAPN
jgi:hypothetical protein